MEYKRSPIVIFCFDRKDLLSKMIESLKKCHNVEKHDAYIFSDINSSMRKQSESKVGEVREYLDKLAADNPFKTLHIIKRKTHFGCKKNIIEGVSEIINRYGSIIDVEDDLLLSSDFLDFIQEGLNVFEGRKDIWSIAGFTYPYKNLSQVRDSIYLAKRICSWGFGTWADRWNKVDWDISDYCDFKRDLKRKDAFSKWGYDLPEMLRAQMEEGIDTWDIQWAYAAYLNEAMTVYPKQSKSFNVGIIGTHLSGNEITQQRVDLKAHPFDFDSCEFNECIDKEAISVFCSEEQYLKLRDENPRSRAYYNIMEKWMRARDWGVSLAEGLKEKSISRVAIYGYGNLGRHLYYELVRDGIGVGFIIDKNFESIKAEIPVISTEESFTDVEAIIVTPVCDFCYIKEELAKKTEIPIISLSSLLD